MHLLLDLCRRYQEPHRHYHTLEHIGGMLHAGRAFPLDDAQTLAVWFHDAIYDPTRTDNEEQSAALARDLLPTTGAAGPLVDRVARIVLDTKRHVPSTPDAAAVLDLDLMSLAAPWPQFAANTAAIRAEFAHVPDEAFRRGRADFFTRMLQCERLFWTDWGKALEAPARDNLRRAAAG
ncbi:MAG: hypothetical protein IT455_11055 [Planctomycetes bacterium]|nr:hypothetical protein [Planctomycetota bacterium]